jgi:hypothetical protein
MGLVRAEEHKEIRDGKIYQHPADLEVGSYGRASHATQSERG